jgi:hypothetical protein
MNMLGLVTNMPAVLREMTPTADEAIDVWSQRVGQSATLFELPNGKAVGHLDYAKLVHRAMGKTFNHPEMAYMKSHGYLDAPTAEYMESMAALKDRESGWKKFMFGDPGAKGIRKLGVDGFLGFVNDNSEKLSRQFAHIVGLELGQLLKVNTLSQSEWHTFAKDFADRTIANYNPQNRGAFFQSGIGSAMGLFQTYAWNYMTRMFRYIENGNARTAAIQMGMQASMFGIQTVPGWQQFNDIMQWSDDEKQSPWSGVFKNFGPEFGSLLMQGSISSLPKLFGASDGLALYTRGDASVRMPSLFNNPYTQVGTKLFDGIVRGIQMFTEEHKSISSQEITELVAQMAINRPLSGAINEMFNDSVVDKNGNIVADRTKGFLNTVYRVIGTKPLAETVQLQAYYDSKYIQSSEAAKKQRFATSVKATIRDGLTSEKMGEIRKQYNELYADPKKFNTWLKSTFRKATRSKSDLEVEKLLKTEDAERIATMTSVYSDINPMQETEEQWDLSPEATQEIDKALSF